MTQRRTFLLQALAAASLVSPARSLWAEEVQGERVTLRPASEDLYRVRIEMDLSGNVNLAKNELVSKERSRQLPIKYKSVIDFEERLSRDAQQRIRGARRYYHEALSEGKTAGRANRIDLRDSARHIATHLGEARSVTYAQHSYLTHEELDLLEIPLNSLALDQILPVGAIGVDETYQVDSAGLRRLLDMDGIQDSTVEGKLVSLDVQRARLELQGTVQGSVSGVPTVVDLAGKITFDLESRTCTWVAMAIRERREIGKAEPGFEISATIKMIRKPLDQAVAVSDEPLEATAPPAQLLVNLFSVHGRYGILMDRRWQMISQSSGLSTLRMVQDDRDIAQCDVRHLPSLQPGRQLTLEALQGDIRQSLGEQFSEFLKLDEQATSSNLRAVRLHAVGSVQGVPVHWVFAHCSDDSGRRVLATFTMAAENVEHFAGADEQFVHSLRFLDSAAENAEDAAENASEHVPENSAPAAAAGEPSEQQAQRKAEKANSRR